MDYRVSDGRARISLRLESSQLRMVAVALGAVGQNFLGEQHLAPRRDHTIRIELSGGWIVQRRIVSRVGAWRAKAALLALRVVAHARR